MALEQPFGAAPQQLGPEDNAAKLYQLQIGEDEVAWRSRARVVLTPMAAPSIMGLFGFAIATMMVGAWQAGWYGGAATGAMLWPFALFVGGVPQIIAAIACLRARDGVAVAVHTVWGAFWIGWSVLQILVVTHMVPAIPFSGYHPAIGFWFIGLAAVTISACLASLGKNFAMFVTLGTLAAGSSLTAAGWWSASHGVLVAGGWLFLISAACAWYVGTAMILENAFGRTILPLGHYSKAANVPGARSTTPIAFPEGMPGVRVGQ